MHFIHWPNNNFLLLAGQSSIWENPLWKRFSQFLSAIFIQTSLYPNCYSWNKLICSHLEWETLEIKEISLSLQKKFGDWPLLPEQVKLNITFSLFHSSRHYTWAQCLLGTSLGTYHRAMVCHLIFLTTVQS